MKNHGVRRPEPCDRSPSPVQSITDPNFEERTSSEQGYYRIDKDGKKLVGNTIFSYHYESRKIGESIKYEEKKTKIEGVEKNMETINSEMTHETPQHVRKDFDKLEVTTVKMAGEDAITRTRDRRSTKEKKEINPGPGMIVLDRRTPAVRVPSNRGRGRGMTSRQAPTRQAPYYNSSRAELIPPPMVCPLPRYPNLTSLPSIFNPIPTPNIPNGAASQPIGHGQNLVGSSSIPVPTTTPPDREGNAIQRLKELLEARNPNPTAVVPPPVPAVAPSPNESRPTPSSNENKEAETQDKKRIPPLRIKIDGPMMDPSKRNAGRLIIDISSDEEVGPSSCKRRRETPYPSPRYQPGSPPTPSTRGPSPRYQPSPSPTL